ncbi:hypothetical protein DEU56DRAFT_794468 [Suillus clintonianus]|uniref:uncharacterized protein n=1 Tax=Suillus clintonianus TaxID=1904413 RepID=UPI001B8814F6|nr:uncharacterized protein DEU56DRAFT_794468 [Suillus clintonianus]KAG2142445.1 hypothetical protein DEU56DRAFT_794468 [Suillus clintonianus]
MFTPPPSPLPSKRFQSSESHKPKMTDDTPTCANTSASPTHSYQSKQKHTLTLRWTIILVPLTLITIAVSTRFFVHPTVFDAFSPTSSQGWKSWTNSLTDWSLHQRHKSTGDLLHLSDTSPSPFIKRSTPSTTSAPTVPINPTLPTPFPQPYDTTLSPNFSTTSCYNFFLNMTQTDALRSCRPFSLLLTHSQAFIQIQDDINATNTDIWGTCNTGISQSQCDLNMAWFASSLRSSCATDLSDQNLMAVSALTGLQAYDLMREAACSVDPVANAYCYVEAVASSDPSSYYFYQLPLGLPLPKITNGACNSCTKSLVSMYSAALSSTNATSLTGLQFTYADAANKLNSACGSSYAQSTTVASSSAPPSVKLTSVGGWAVLLAVGVLSTSISS